MSNARELERLVRRACAEDGPSVDPEAMRALKRAVRADENALRCAHEALVGIVRGGRSSAGKRTRAVTATAELFEQSPDGRLVQARALRKRFGGRGSPVFGVELEPRNANAVRGGIVATPAIQHMVRPDHCLQGILDRW